MPELARITYARYPLADGQAPATLRWEDPAGLACLSRFALGVRTGLHTH